MRERFIVLPSFGYSLPPSTHVYVPSGTVPDVPFHLTYISPSDLTTESQRGFLMSLMMCFLEFPGRPVLLFHK